MDDLLPPSPHFKHNVLSEPASSSTSLHESTRFADAFPIATQPDIAAQKHVLPVSTNGTPILDIIAPRQNAAEYMRHTAPTEMVSTALANVIAQHATPDNLIKTSFKHAGAAASKTLIIDAQTSPFAALAHPATQHDLTFLASHAALLTHIESQDEAPQPRVQTSDLPVPGTEKQDKLPKDNNAQSTGLHHDSGPPSRHMAQPFYDMHFDEVGGVGGSDSGWDIGVGPIGPSMPGYFPPPMMRPSPAEIRWNNAHSPSAMATYSSIFRDIYGRDASNVDLDWAARQVGRGMSIEEYRWEQAHTSTALNLYRDIFRNVHGRDAQQVDVDFAANKIGRNASLQQYRWDEAHNNAALGQEYRDVYRSVHGREAAQIDIDFAANKIGNGASLQQYRWDEAHNNEALGREYRSVFESVHGREAAQVDINFAADKIGNGASLQQYRWDEAHNNEALNSEYRAVFKSVHGHEAAQIDIDFAADKIGYGASLQQYRWDEAHNNEALGREYRDVFETVHGREASTVDLNWAADKIGNGASVQQYRWDEAHNAEAQTHYAQSYRNIYLQEASAAQIDAIAQKIGDGASWQQVWRDEAQSISARAAYAQVFKKVHGHDPTQTDVDWAANQITDGLTLQQYREIEAHNAESTKALTAIHEEILGTAPTAAQLQTSREILGSGQDFAEIRNRLAYSTQSTSYLTQIYDSAVAGIGEAYNEAKEVGRAIWIKTIQYAEAHKEMLVKDLTPALLTKWIPNPVFRAIAAFIARQGIGWIDEAISRNTVNQAKIALQAPSPDGGGNPYPSPSIVTLRKFFDTYISADDVDIIGHINSLPVNERLPFLRELIGATEEELRTALIMANALPDDLTTPPGDDGHTGSSDGSGGPPDDGHNKLDKFPKLGQSDGGPGTYVKANESFKEDAAAYQERVTGTPKGIAYRVPKGPDDFVKFDGYDAERDVLQDAKLLRNWPKPDLKFSRDEVMRQLRAQLEAAKGKAIEWIVPDQVAADRLMEVFSEEGFLPAENNFSVRIAP